jgi:hypothetical protein
MLFLGLNQLQWTAIAAIGGLSLAVAAVITIIVTVRLARSDRTRDDAKRQDDRQWDSQQRKEDRDYDAEQRRQDREHAEQLRAEDDLKWERRLRAEQAQQEDREARQVAVEVRRAILAETFVPSSPGHDYTHRLTISAPASYELKQPEAQIVHNSNGHLALRPTGHRGDAAIIEDGRVIIRMWAEIPEQLFEPFPIVRFVDRHGNLYYAYRQRTERFPQNTDFITAAVQIDQWIRTGPKPDEPGSA